MKKILDGPDRSLIAACMLSQSPFDGISHGGPTLKFKLEGHENYWTHFIVLKPVHEGIIFIATVQKVDIHQDDLCILAHYNPITRVGNYVRISPKALSTRSIGWFASLETIEQEKSSFL